MGGKAVGCFGAITQSKRSSSSAASTTPAHVATVVKLQWHPTRAVSGQGSGGGSRRQEFAKREGVKGLVGHGIPVRSAESTLQAIYHWNCRFLTNKKHLLQRWQHNGLFQAMVNPLLWQVPSMCLIVPILADWICPLSPERQMEMFIITFPRSGEM